MKDDKETAAIDTFNTVTRALLSLDDEEAQKRVLRAAAILIGIEFIEEQAKCR